MAVSVAEFGRLQLLRFAVERPQPGDRFTWRPGDIHVVAPEDSQTSVQPQGGMGLGAAPPVTAEGFSQAWHDSVTRNAPLVNKLQDAYTEALRKQVSRAAKNLEDRAHVYSVVTAAGEPTWAIPNQDEIYEKLIAEAELKEGTDPWRVKISNTVVHDVAVALGLSFDVTNPLLHDAFKQFGQKITNIAEGQRGKIMGLIQRGYDEGLSVPGTAKLLLNEGGIDSMMRATRIARTEFIGGTNGGASAMMQLAGVKYRQWVATNDSRTRDDHAEADGQVVPLNQPFDIGGEALNYPGDPNGSAAEIINCRCTIIAADNPQGSPTPVQTQFGPGSPFAPGGWNPNLAQISQNLPGFFPETLTAAEPVGFEEMMAGTRDWGKALSASRTKAVKLYIRDATQKPLAERLRHHLPLDDLEGVAKDLDEAISSAPQLGRSMRVYRGVRDVEGMDLKVGAQFTDPAYVSTSLDREVAENFSLSATGPTPNRALFEIDLPPNERGVFTSAVSSDESDLWAQEFVLPRDSTFEVLSVDSSGEFPVYRVRVLNDEALAGGDTVSSVYAEKHAAAEALKAENLKKSEEIAETAKGAFDRISELQKAGEFPGDKFGDVMVGISKGEIKTAEDVDKLLAAEGPAPAIAEGLPGEVGGEVKVGTPSWKPVMSPSEADSYIENSAIKEPLYHGVPTDDAVQNIRANGFDPQRALKQLPSEGFYFSVPKNVALDYAKQDEKRVLEVRVNIKNPMPADEMWAYVNDGHFGPSEAHSVREYAESKGYDGLNIDHLPGGKVNPEPEVVAFRPDQVVVVDHSLPAMAEGFTPGGLGAEPYTLEKSQASEWTAKIGDKTVSIPIDKSLGWSEGFMAKRADAIAQELSKLSPQQLDKISDVVTKAGANPEDGLLAEKYGIKTFKSAANYKDGQLTFYNGKFSPGAIQHEAGHAIGADGSLTTDLVVPDSWLLPYQGGPIAPEEWAQAALTDSGYGTIHDFQIAGEKSSIFTPTPGSLGVTKYGETLINEDWAEAIRLYKSGIKLEDGTTVPFADVFPNRAKILDEVFGKIEGKLPLPEVAPKVEQVAVQAETQIPDFGPLAPGKSAGGSTGAKYATSTSGEEYVAKAYSGNTDRVATEALSNKIYQDLGVNVPQGGVGEMGGDRVFAAKVVPGATQESTFSVAQRERLAQDYVSHAYLANWDFVGLAQDNILWNGLEPTYLDQGGTLFYRAQGSLKDFSSTEVKELDSLLKGQAYGFPVTEQDIAQQAAKLGQIMTDAKIDALVDSADFSPEMAAEVRTALKGRAQYLRDYADGHGIKLSPEPAPILPPAEPPVVPSPPAPVEAAPEATAVPTLPPAHDVIQVSEFVDSLSSTQWGAGADEKAMTKYAKYANKLKGDQVLIVSKDDAGGVIGLTRYNPEALAPDTLSVNTYLLNEGNREKVLQDVLKQAQSLGKQKVELVQVGEHEDWLTSLGFKTETDGKSYIASLSDVKLQQPLVQQITPVEKWAAKDFAENLATHEYAPGTKGVVEKYVKYQAGLKVPRQLLVVRNEQGQIESVLAYVQPTAESTTLEVNAFVLSDTGVDKAVTEAAKLAAEEGKPVLAIREAEKGIYDVSSKLEALGFKQSGKTYGIQLKDLDVQHGGTLTETLSTTEPALTQAGVNDYLGQSGIDLGSKQEIQSQFKKGLIQTQSQLEAAAQEALTAVPQKVPSLEKVATGSKEIQDFVAGLPNDKWASSLADQADTLTQKIPKYGYGKSLYIARNAEGEIEGIFTIDTAAYDIGNFLHLRPVVIAPGRAQEVANLAMKQAAEEGKGVWVTGAQDELANALAEMGFKADKKAYESGLKLISTSVKKAAKSLPDVTVAAPKVEALDIGQYGSTVLDGADGLEAFQSSDLTGKGWADGPMWSSAKNGDKLLSVTDAQGDIIGQAKLSEPISEKSKGFLTFSARTAPENSEALEATLRKASEEAAKEGKGLALVYKGQAQREALEKLGFHAPTDAAHQAAQYAEWRQLTAEEVKKLAQGQKLPAFEVPKVGPKSAEATQAGFKKELLGKAVPAQNWPLKANEIRGPRGNYAQNLLSKTTDWIKKVSVGSALQRYSGSYAYELNARLRLGRTLSYTDMREVKVLDAAMENKIPLPDGFVTWRVQNLDYRISHDIQKFVDEAKASGGDYMDGLMAWVNTKYKVGMEADTAGQYWSSTVTPEAYGDYDQKMIFEIIPKRGVYMKNKSGISREDEFLLPKDARFIVKGIDVAKTKKGSRCIFLQLEQVY